MRNDATFFGSSCISPTSEKRSNLHQTPHSCPYLSKKNNSPFLTHLPNISQTSRSNISLASHSPFWSKLSTQTPHFPSFPKAQPTHFLTFRTSWNVYILFTQFRNSRMPASTPKSVSFKTCFMVINFWFIDMFYGFYLTNMVLLILMDRSK